MNSKTVNKILAVLAAISTIVIGIGLIDKEGTDLIIESVSAILMSILSYTAFKTGNGTINDIKTNLLAAISAVVLVLEYFGESTGWQAIIVIIINAAFSIVAILNNKDKDEDVDAIVDEIDKRSLRSSVKHKL